MGMTASRDPKMTTKIMSAIHSQDTKPEMLIRKALFRDGFRYRVHYKALPGKPDVVFTRVKLAVFIDGDFWHGHNWAIRNYGSLEDELQRYSPFWQEKIRRNVERDRATTESLESMGWVVMRLWESDIEKDLEGNLLLIESCYLKLDEVGRDSK